MMGNSAHFIPGGAMKKGKENMTSGVSVLMLLDALRRRKFYILIPTLLLIAAFAALGFYLPPRYRTEVTIAAEAMVGQDYLKPTSPAIDVQKQLLAIRETLFRRSLLEDVIREFSLYKEGAGRVPDQALRDMTSRIQIRVEGEETFSISFEGGDARQVADVANRLAERFIQQRLASREWRAEAAAEFLDAEVERLKKRLVEQESAIRDYKQRSVRELPEHLATNLRLLETLQEQLQQKTEAIVEAEARHAAVQKEIQELEKHGLGDGKEPVIKSQAEVKLEKLQLTLKELRKRYKDRHPEIVRLKSEIEELERTVAQEPARQTEDPSPLHLRYIQLKAELEANQQRLKSYQSEKEDLTSRIEHYQQRIESAPQHERTLAQLIRDYEITRGQYQELLTKQHEATLAQHLEEANKGVVFRVIEPARVPSGPHAPKHYRLILMGLLSGLGLGIALAFLAEQMDTSFDSVEEFHSFTNLPVLGVIPSIPAVQIARTPSFRRKRRRKAALSLVNSQDPAGNCQPNIVTLRDPYSVVSEQYRVLTTKVCQHLDHSRSQVLMVTSPAGDEGKTTTAVNLSVILSELVDGRVLLIDADLRKPCVQAYLNIKPAHRFCDLLSQPEQDLSQYLQTIKRLYLLTSRGGLQDPIAVLSSPGTGALLDRLRQEFRYIVIDATPILPIADSHILAGMVDAVLLVVRARRTRRELLQHALERFDSDNVMGVVLNDFYYRRSRYAYAYAYYQKHYLTQKSAGEAQ